jgi:glycosyltransferase involved in cell wall biosynthesis
LDQTPARPIRIVHAISSPAAGGAEVYVKDLVLETARQGHHPAIAFLSRSADIGRTDAFERAYLAELDKHHIPYAFLGHECRRNPLLGAFRVRKFCREQSADVYHSHLKYSLLFAAGLRIPHIHTHHNVRRHAPAWLWPVFNRIVDSYVGISELCSMRLQAFSGRPVTTIRNAVDPHRLGAAPGARTFTAGQIIRCIAVGSPTQQKNFGLLVDAVAMLPKHVRDRVTLDIVGESPPEAFDALALRIQAAELGDCIRLLGSRTDVAQLLARADLFLMSSAWEGMPIALLEATMSGLPFIATDVGGCAEMARRFGNGIVVPPGATSAYAQALATIINDPDKMEGFSQAALANASELSIDSCAAAHLQLYARLLGKRLTPGLA